MHKKAKKYIDTFFKGNVEGKTIIITGGNAGVGFESARYALYLKMNVIIGVRSISRGEQAIKKIKEDFPEAKISLMEVDMSEEQSIINFVNKLKDNKIDIDVFYHNAGVYNLPFQLKEGRELVISTNFYGPLMLTSLLLPYLHSLNHEVKMVFTSSVAASRAKVDETVLVPNNQIGKMQTYCNSKLLDAYLFKYLYDNDKQNIKYYLVHPGVTGTSLFSKAFKSRIFVWMVDVFMKLVANPLYKSALSIIKVLSSDNEPGKFYGPYRFFSWKGYPKDVSFLNNKFNNVDDIIKKSEIVVGYKLIK